MVEELSGSNKGLEDEFTLEKVRWVLGIVKKRKAVDKDVISVEMMSANFLKMCGVKLINVCWRFGVMPSLWKYSIIVPVLKKRMREVCDTNDFRSISLTSLVCWIMCMVLNKRLTTVWKRRACWLTNKVVIVVAAVVGIKFCPCF